ncbi:hypothetical protein LF1_46980 [Rubripirellula obstinata]|uniref:Uncharacterized protein n=1 Tax=Rubripirellula obstinata TaxID=406547 RepID=A0A5B1CLQ8_9BACT|nr:hypothetical protein [Rubripirellula obstinata]KAA1262137.1 hypothetical protein LF1_46980 [Rubripirellula obstinata]
MSYRNPTSSLFCFLAIGMFCIVGCGPTESSTEAPVENAGHDHGHDHDHAGHNHDFENLGEALVELEELSDEIGVAFTSGEPESAHDALHHISEVLEATETVVSKSSLGEETKAEALKAVEELFDSYTALDETMHGDGGKDFDEVKSSIESAIAVLKSAAKE